MLAFPWNKLATQILLALKFNFDYFMVKTVSAWKTKKNFSILIIYIA